MIDFNLRHLVRQIEARYPGVHVLMAEIRTFDDGTRQQNLRLQAPIEVLRANGLLTARVDAQQNAPPRCWNGVDDWGNHFGLYDRFDCLSKPGHWDLMLYTRSVPYERERFSVREAERVLKRIAKASRAKPKQ